MIKEKRSEESNTNSPATDTDAVETNAAKATNATVLNAVGINSQATIADSLHSATAIVEPAAHAAKAKNRAGEKITSPLIRNNLFGRVRYWWSWTLAALMLLIIAPPVLLISAVAGRREWVYPFARFGARTWLRLSGVRVSVKGAEFLDPHETYIFISNHRSYLDTAALFRYVGKRRIGILAKKELLKVPILGYGMGFVNVMAIDRSNHERALETVRAATEKIKSGVSFGVFAEGTRAAPGELLPFKKGAFFMAIETGAPIVPVAMKNTDVLMGKGTGVLQRGAMEVVFMPPIETKNLTAEDVPMLVERVRNEIKRELQMPLSE